MKNPFSLTKKDIVSICEYANLIHVYHFGVAHKRPKCSDICEINFETKRKPIPVAGRAPPPPQKKTNWHYESQHFVTIYIKALILV